jgi:signal transduction histidine kinase
MTTRGEAATLRQEMRWLIRLRWIAGGCILGVTMLGVTRDDQVLEHRLIALAIVILVYNTIFRYLCRGPHRPVTRPARLVVAHAQIGLDLLSLTHISLWTGGLTSPFLSLFVLPMVFAGLLLPLVSAYGAAAVAITMILIGLVITGGLPGMDVGMARFLEWAALVLATTYLASHLAVGLRRRDQALVWQRSKAERLNETLKRQQVALVQSEKLSAMGRLAAGVAHEVANPLASLDSVILLNQRRGSVFDEEHTSVLRKQIARIEAIVRSLTAFTHPGEGMRERTLLDAVVDEALDVVRFDSRLRDITLERQRCVVEVSVDKLALQQVFVNLFVNAFDALRGVEDARLVVRTRRDGDTAIVEVIDNGPGIGPEDLEHLFEPFFTTKPVGEGTGLGLSISYSIMERYGGRIDVESPPDGGARFSACLPVSHV